MRLETFIQVKRQVEIIERFAQKNEHSIYFGLRFSKWTSLTKWLELDLYRGIGIRTWNTFIPSKSLENDRFRRYRPNSPLSKCFHPLFLCGDDYTDTLYHYAIAVCVTKRAMKFTFDFRCWCSSLSFASLFWIFQVPKFKNECVSINQLRPFGGCISIDKTSDTQPKWYVHIGQFVWQWYVQAWQTQNVMFTSNFASGLQWILLNKSKQIICFKSFLQPWGHGSREWMYFPNNTLFIDTSAIYIQRKTNQRIPTQSGIAIATCIRTTLV